SRRQPGGESSLVGGGDGAHGPRSANPGVRDAAHDGGADQEGDNPLPQTVHRAGDLPSATSRRPEKSGQRQRGGRLTDHRSINAEAPTTKETQYYEMAGTRGIWHKGWKASTEHAPMPSDQGHFDQDRWQLFHTDVDRSEARDLAAEEPTKLKELQELWLAEA